MTEAEMLAIYQRLTADLYQQMEEEQAAHHHTAMKLQEQRAELLERDRTIADLHEHIAVLERPPSKKTR